MENSLVTYGFNKDKERIEHRKWICDQLCTVSRLKKDWKSDNQELVERKLVVYFVLHYSRKRFFMERV